MYGVVVAKYIPSLGASLSRVCCTKHLGKDYFVRKVSLISFAKEVKNCIG